MEQYTNYCTEEQTKRAFKLGAPLSPCKENTYMQMGVWYTSDRKIVYNTDEYQKYYVPTTQQMIGWLREKGIVNLGVYLCQTIETPYYYSFVYDKKIYGQKAIYNTFAQAELAAIDLALDYLEKR